jgi:hypothetical protein
VLVGPGAVRGDLVSGRPPAKTVNVSEQYVVNLFQITHKLAACYLFSVVKLRHSIDHVSHHVITHQRIVGVRVNLDTEE